jgi:exodeoxyribonuclease-5
MDFYRNENENKQSVTFTDDQSAAIDELISFIATTWSDKDFIRGLCGPGGTGKTFVTKYIIENCKYSHSVIKCTAPTHKACRVLNNAIGNIRNVETIQSTFGLRLDLKLEDFDPERPQFNPIAGPKLDNIKLLIVDEASMLPAKLVKYIISTCKKLNIKIIFQGDSFQLPPVGEKQSYAFTQCYKTNYLNEIVRQGNDNPIKDILSILREDIKNKTYRFLEFISKNRNKYFYNDVNEGFFVCGVNKFKELVDKSFLDEEYTKNIDMYRIVAYTNKCVSSWNNYIRHTIIKDNDKAIITKNDLIMSYETIVDEYLSIIINNSEEYIIKDITNYVDDKYGFKGFLVKFQMIHGGNITKPLFIIDHRDKFTIQKYDKVITELINAAKSASTSTRGTRWKEYYNFKKKYLLATNVINKSGKIIYYRDIDYGFAISSHKSQGSTYDTVFVDVNNMVFDSNGTPYANQDELLRRLYVACSRARKNLILCYGN